MRISTANSFDTTVNSLIKRQQDMSEAQLQLTSGKRVNKASDDPAAAARAERALAAMAPHDASLRAPPARRTAMEQPEGALADAGELLQRAREIMVASGNASYSDTERASLANELREIRSQLLAVANRSDGAGSYVFAGQGAAEPPFVDLPGGVEFRGAGGQLSASNGESMPLTIDGQATWLAARTGNGVFATSGTSTNAWIDNGRVVDPSALTGATYTVQFGDDGAGNRTSTVLADGNPTALTDMPYETGKAIQLDGLSFTISGTPDVADSFTLTPSTASLTVFDAIDQAAASLATPNLTSAERTQAPLHHLNNLDSAMGNLQTTRAAVGAAMNRLDGMTDRLEEQKLGAETER